MSHRSEKSSEHVGRAVVITGASGGIGRACVTRARDLGFSVIGMVRGEPGDELLTSCTHCVRLDLANPDSPAEAADAVLALDLPLHAVVNGAGTVRLGAVEDLSMDDLREVFEVNVLGPLRFTRSLLPGLRPSRGRIVNIGSGAGFLAMPLNGAYCMAKHAMEALSDTLRIELASSGVHVSVVSPGRIETPMHADARQQLARLEKSASAHYRELAATRAGRAERAGAPPDRVARAVARAIVAPRPKARYFVGVDSRASYLLGRLIPERLRRIAYRRLLGAR